MAKKRFRIKDSQGNVVPYDVAAEDVTMADGRSVEAGKASLKAVAGFLDPAHFPIVMLYNVAPFTSTPDYSSIPVGIVYLDESLTAPYKRMYYKKSVEGTAQSIDLGAPKDGVIYFHQSTGKLYRWVATSQGNDGSFTQIGILGINDIPGLADAIAAAGSGAVTVTTNQDGTFTIHVGDNDYTVNLNHTHEHMAKLVICEESDLPSTLDMDTIYAQVDDADTPTEIQSLWIAGLEFVGGGGAAPGTPSLSSPGANISMGDVENGSVTKTIRIKGRFLTQNLSASLTGTGYTFGTTQPTGVTRNSDTSLTITADAAKAGVDISVVYTGTAFNATATLTITSSSPDSIDVESTLLANELDTDGLIGHWDAADAPSSGAWVDRINSMKLNLGGTAAHDSGGYRLNNLSAPKNAWLYLDTSETTLLNTEIDKEFTCIIDCEVKFTATSKAAMLVDFGCFGTAVSGVSMYVASNQGGTLKISTKKNGNNSVTPNANNVSIPSFTLGTYVPIRLVCGCRIASNNVQVVYAKVGTSEANSYISTPVTVNFQGADLGYAFGCGIIYITGNGLNYATDYLADVIYKSIIIYNKKV